MQNAVCKMQKCGVPSHGFIIIIFFRVRVKHSAFCILHFAFLFFQRKALLDFHQRIQKRLQILFPVKLQLEAALALAVDDLHAPAQMLA